MVSPASRRRVVERFRDGFEMSERRACRLADASRSLFRYRSLREDQALRQRILELAADRPRFGYRRIHTLLRRESPFETVNHKRVYRLYREEHLLVRRKKRKRVAEANRPPRLVPELANEQWSVDFMSDSLSDGRQFRTLNVVDDATRECLAIEVDTSLGGWRVTRVLDEIAQRRPLAKRLVLDNGTEFTSKALDQWAYQNGVELHFIRPGRPIENCFVESFNGKFRDECLNAHWFTSLDEARALIAAWRDDYNHVRPHSSLGSATPAEFAASLLSTGEESADAAA